MGAGFVPGPMQQRPVGSAGRASSVPEAQHGPTQRLALKVSQTFLLFQPYLGSWCVHILLLFHGVLSSYCALQEDLGLIYGFQKASLLVLLEG